MWAPIAPLAHGPRWPGWQAGFYLQVGPELGRRGLAGRGAGCSLSVGLPGGVVGHSLTCRLAESRGAAPVYRQLRLTSTVSLKTFAIHWRSPSLLHS